MSELLKFNEEQIDRKDIKNGICIKLDENGVVRYIQVESVSSCKNGKHGAAKTLVAAKDIITGNNRNLIYTSSDKATVVKMQKLVCKLVDFSNNTITIIDQNNNYDVISLDNSMDKSDIKKIEEVVRANPNVEEFNFVCRALPGYYKLDSIKPAE